MVLTRRSAIQMSAVIGSGPFFLRQGFAEDSAKETAPSAFSLDLMNYVMDSMAPRAIQHLKGNRTPLNQTELLDLSSKFHLLSRHAAFVGVDSQVRGALAQAGQLEVSDDAGKAILNRVATSVAAYLQSYDPDVTTDMVASSLSPLPPMTSFTSSQLTASLQLGLSNQGHVIGDNLKAKANSLDAVKVKYGRPGYGQPHIQEVICYKGNTAAERQAACRQFWDGIALLVFGVGSLTCLVIPACAAAYSLAAAAGGFSGAAALAFFLQDNANCGSLT